MASIQVRSDDNTFSSRKRSAVENVARDLGQKPLASTSSLGKRFTAENIARDFGHISPLSHRAIKILYEKLIAPKSTMTKDLFEEWKKEVSIAYPGFGEEIRKIADIYGLTGDVDGEKLFLAIQTYYAIILKLIAAQVASKFSKKPVPAFLDYLKTISETGKFKRALESVESGELFERLGIKGFTEKGFYSWYLEEWDRDIEGLLRDIVGKLSEYDVTSLYQDVESARDMFKILYEELIPRLEVRKKLGIYLTPDWLAELVIKESGLEERLSDPCNVRVLDPSCGTGTFLSLVIQKIGRLSKSSWETLKCVVENVVGFDIEPLAVLTAKTNYLIALAATGLLSHRRGDIEIPVYMANSLLPIEYEADNLGNALAVRVTLPSGVFPIPKKLVDNGVVDRFLDDLEEAINRGVSVDAVARKYELTDTEAQLVRELYDKLARFKSEGMDTVLISELKSALTPYRFQGYFDYIVGNPPWLVYRNISDPNYQAILKRMAKDVYRLVVEEHLMGHMDLATLFFVRMADKYLKENGVIGFVIPRAIFNATQHHAFRSGSFAKVNLKFEEIIDTEKVEPLFPVPTTAVIARKGEKTEYPVKGLVVEGKLPEHRHKVMPLNEALKHLKVKGVKFYYNKIGTRSFLYPEKIGVASHRSPYYGEFYAGASINPQSVWLVDVVDASNPEVVVVQSSRRSLGRGKVKRRIPPMPVEREFIYGVLTSAELLPFTHLPPNIAVLPIRPKGEGYEIITKNQARAKGYTHLSKWLSEAERIYKEARGAKKADLYHTLDYHRSLTGQSSKKKYRVVYTSSATYLTSAVTENKPIEVELDTGRVRLNGIIIDSTLYRYDTNNEDEAYYLASILNSSFVDKAIKPMQTRGLYGPRDIQKRPLELPIPKYNPNNVLHRELAELGKEATRRANMLLPNLLKRFGYDARLRERGYLLPQEVGRLRSVMRAHLEDILSRINKLTTQILSNQGGKSEGIIKWI